MVVRYMGTKRHMAEHVFTAITSLDPQGRCVDLFSGMGSVAEEFQDALPIATNDALSFTAAIARARFTGSQRETNSAAVLADLVGPYKTRIKQLSDVYRTQIEQESIALAGSMDDLVGYMNRARHVGNSPELRKKAARAMRAVDGSHYQLATLYFSAGYLSLTQAIQADAIRAAIDKIGKPEERDWLVGSWLAAISVLVNAPGHTAQFLRPNTETSHRRIVRTWQRSLWQQFELALDGVSQIGGENWRMQNRVYVGDALDLVAGKLPDDVGVVYADPPYTKDQYSRYYHVYESLYRYDYPESRGAGRSRPDRFTTGFCLKTAVVASFHDLCRNVARMKVPLIISYPSQGLLNSANTSIPAIAGQYFAKVNTRSVQAKHSTMGASNGQSKKAATENLYVCTS